MQNKPSHAEILDVLHTYLQAHPDEMTQLGSLRAQLEDAGDVWGSRKNMRGHVTASALVLSADRSDSLLIHHNVYKRWVEPGGHYEGIGSLWELAVREVDEETGVRGILAMPALAGIGLPLDIETHPIGANPSKDEGAHFHHDFMYLAIAPSNAQLVPQLEEVGGVQWFPLSRWPERMEPRALRLAAKLRKLGLAL